MRTLLRALAACVLTVVVLEGASFLLLGAIALRGGYASTYFTALLPHPAVSRRLAEVIPAAFHLVKYERHIVVDGVVHGEFEWHPLLGYYRPFLPDGTLRDRPTFQGNELGVYVIGGSTVEGGGISTHLQAMLQEELKDRYAVRVINEGVGGYLSTQEMVLLQTKILPFGNPRYVIAVDGYNDWLVTLITLLSGAKEKVGVTEEMWPRADLSWAYHWFGEWRGRRAITTIPGAFVHLVSLVAKQLLPRTYTGWLLSHVGDWVNILWLPKFGVSTLHLYTTGVNLARAVPLPPARAELQAMNERMMAEACEVRGARFFWVLQPGLPYRQGAMTAEERSVYGSRPVEYWRSLESYYEEVRAIAARDAEFWTSRFLDLSSLRPEDTSSVFIDNVHLSDAGARRVAQELARLILDDLATRPEAPPRTAVVAQDVVATTRRP